MRIRAITYRLISSAIDVVDFLKKNFLELGPVTYSSKRHFKR